MKRCCQCGGGFGLVRHAILREQFCSKMCLEGYQRDLDMKRSWLRSVMECADMHCRQGDLNASFCDGGHSRKPAPFLFFIQR
jgi:hypothetical protein